MGQFEVESCEGVNGEGSMACEVFGGTEIGTN